ncbi:hypothetical protein K435DRAFT_803183 [Dendrothele bispora CBS 962.96]|uniref:DUF4219 domain-containing protein n=1 Tax=Dendrothele bispora (strain CBS 962.96) TaxID=1314807 RepID=A0A4V4HDW2_DENBC|nr:hypothetical protein K435DRAFT_803183 [Dendrothele bispora CBS 962.96]
MSSNGNSFANFENLNANNWTLWSNNMKNYLRIQNCWFAIEKEKSEYAVRPLPRNIPPVLAADGTTTSPGSTLQPTDKQLKDYDDKLKDWEEANQKAIGIIGMKIPTNLSHLQKDTVKLFWETLQSQYGKVSTAALVTKLLDLFCMTFKPRQNPAVTVDSFKNKYIEISTLNDKIQIPEFVLCALLLHKIGQGWDNFISNIMTNEYTPDKTTGVDEHWTLDHLQVALFFLKNIIVVSLVLLTTILTQMSPDFLESRLVEPLKVLVPRELKTLAMELNVLIPLQPLLEILIRTKILHLLLPLLLPLLIRMLEISEEIGTLKETFEEDLVEITEVVDVAVEIT